MSGQKPAHRAGSTPESHQVKVPRQTHRRDSGHKLSSAAAPPSNTDRTGLTPESHQVKVPRQTHRRDSGHKLSSAAAPPSDTDRIGPTPEPHQVKVPSQTHRRDSGHKLSSAAAPPSDTGPGATAGSSATGTRAWRRLGSAMHPRPTRAQVTAGLLCLILGFGVATQFRQTQEADFSTLRQNELIEVLDQLTVRADRLRQDNDQLERQLEGLADSRTQEEAARQAALDQAQTQGILAGTIAAQGPGIKVMVNDPDGVVDAALITALVDELRNAGAEAISVGDVRVTVSTWFTAGRGGVMAEDQLLTPPYAWLAIGDPTTLQGALGLAGGALAAMHAAGATTTVSVFDLIEITAVKILSPASYAMALE